MVKPIIIISYCIFNVFLYAYVSGSEFSNQWLIKSDMDSNGLEKLAGKLGFRILTKLPTNHYVLSRDDVPKWSKHKANVHTKRLLQEKTVGFVRQEVWETVGFKQSSSFHPRDPYWNLMWYMNEKSNNSLGILESWNLNYTGNGVKIAILDGGVEYKHKDLFNRFEKGVDLYDGDSDPSPPASDSGHGTKCAGIALATTNTDCIIGVAYNARLIAIRLFGPSRQALSSSKVKALTDKDVHVSSNSWGVLDNTIENVMPEITEALRYGVTNLRDGKGVIYVFAGGNGGSGDNCNLDPYVNSIYTIGINSVTKGQISPGTAEPCTAVLTSTYTGNGLPRSDIYSTTVGGKCITDFKGTSASTPMAAGIIALGLEANPNLHWRDVQELIIRSSKTDGLKSGNFVVNGVGRKVSDVYGYGIINAKNFISMAVKWKSLPAQHTCESDFINDPMEIDETRFTRSVESVQITDGCNFTSNCVNKLEHVEARVVFEYSLRGAIEIKLISPFGTVSNLLTYRGRDSAKNGKFDWTYMSVHHWGEGVIGKWKLNVSIAAGEKEKGKLIGWKLILHGTGEGCTKEDEPQDFVASQRDPCVNHTTTNDTTYRTDSNTTPLQSSCGLFPPPPWPQWYRFTSTPGGEIATQCPRNSTCGARNQLWINDTLPNYAEGEKNVRTCLQRSSDCCANGKNIVVKNCNGFYVYRLDIVPGCSRFCVNATALIPPTVSTTEQVTTVVPSTDPRRNATTMITTLKQTDVTETTTTTSMHSSHSTSAAGLQTSKTNTTFRGTHVTTSRMTTLITRKDSSTSPSSEHSRMTIVVYVIVGSVFGLAIVVLVFCLLYRKHRMNQNKYKTKSAREPQHENNYVPDRELNLSQVHGI